MLEINAELNEIAKIKFNNEEYILKEIQYEQLIALRDVDTEDKAAVGVL